MALIPVTKNGVFFGNASEAQIHASNGVLQPYDARVAKAAAEAAAVAAAAEAGGAGNDTTAGGSDTLKGGADPRDVKRGPQK